MSIAKKSRKNIFNGLLIYKLIIDHLIYLLYCKVYVSAGSNTDRLTNVRVLDLEIFSLKSNHEKIHTFLCMIPIGEKTMLIVVEY